MKSEKEVLDALNTLKSLCEETNSCSKCMLRNSDNGCGVMYHTEGYSYDSLKDWQLKDYNNPRLILS